MKVYLAAKYNRRFALRKLRDALKERGIEVTSQWIDNAEESKSAHHAAQMDIDDVTRADALVFFGEPTGSKNTGGGRWFEFGYAYAIGLRLLVVRDIEGYESVFTELNDIPDIRIDYSEVEDENFFTSIEIVDAIHQIVDIK